MYQPDYDRIAQKLTHDGLMIQPGEHVLMEVRSDALPFGARLAHELMRAGATVTLILRSDEFRYHLMKSSFPAAPPPSNYPTVRAIEAADVYIMMGIGSTDPSLFDEMSTHERQLWTAHDQPRLDALERSGRWLTIDIPTRYRASQFGIRWSKYFETFWRSVDMDYKWLYRHTHEVSTALSRGTHYRLVSEHGTDLHFQRGDRAVECDDGRVIKRGNFPTGEVYCFPLEETFEGTLVLDWGRDDRQEVHQLHLSFHKGKGTPTGALAGFDPFLETLREERADILTIGEFGIGTNREIDASVRSGELLMKADGIVHVTLGRNVWDANSAKTAFSWPFFLYRATLYVDGKAILVNGRFYQE